MVSFQASVLEDSNKVPGRVEPRDIELQTGEPQSTVHEGGDIPADLPVRQARAQYFAANDFGADGGYGDTWVDFSLGPIPFPFPNTPMRVRAVRYHDLHHIVTGYRTDMWGELEIAAWEIGAGCGRYLVPWQLNLAGMAMGAWVMPRQLWRAFVRGRRSRSLYGQPYEPLLDMTVAELRQLAQCESEAGAPPNTSISPRPGLADGLLFAAAIAVGMIIALLSLALGLVTLPLGLATLAWRRHQKQATPEVGAALRG